MPGQGPFVTAKPDFLVIGSMKAGTTTLHRDLAGHPQLFLPAEKEPDTLVKFGDDMAKIERDYASLFKPAAAGQICGESSTSYTQRPDHEGAAQRALDLCGPGLKLIHLRRDPVGRIVSHYRHDFGLEIVAEPFAQAVDRHHRYAAYSAYEWQLQPWRAAFPSESLLELSFEDYIADRPGTLQRVCRFLGVDPSLLPPPAEDRAFNRSEGKPVATGPVLAFLGSRIYQRGIKPLIPWALRDKIMHAVLPKARDAEVRLDEQATAGLLEKIAEFEALTAKD